MCIHQGKDAFLGHPMLQHQRIPEQEASHRQHRLEVRHSQIAPTWSWWKPLCYWLAHHDWSKREARWISKWYTRSFQHFKQCPLLKSSCFLLLTNLMSIWESSAYNIFCLKWKMRINTKTGRIKWNLWRKVSNRDISLL